MASVSPAAASATPSDPSATSSQNTNSYLSWLTLKRATVILLATGVTLRATVWDNSYLKTAAVVSSIGAAVGVYVTAKDEKERNLSSLSEAAFLLGFVCGGVSVLYSLAVEGAFQSLAAVGSVITNQ